MKSMSKRLDLFSLKVAVPLRGETVISSAGDECMAGTAADGGQKQSSTLTGLVLPRRFCYPSPVADIGGCDRR